MNNSEKYDIPWEVIADFLTGNMKDDGEHKLKLWLSSDPENEREFLKIQELWKKGTEEYRYYRMANETEAWNALQTKIGLDRPPEERSRVIRTDFSQRRRFIRNLLAIASVCIGVIAVMWYFTVRNNTEVYSTGSSGQKSIALSDGTVINLQPMTRVEVPKGFNSSHRTVIMVTGEADFEVPHMADSPFVVKLGSTEVRDIGTGFIIRRDVKMIHVAVTNGKVVFVRTVTKETKELEAGSSVTFDERKEEFSEIKAIESSGAFDDLLIFENTPLSEVIGSVQRVYAKKIVIGEDISGKKLTAKLYDMPFDTALEVICSSLDLEYTVNENIYLLKNKTTDE